LAETSFDRGANAAGSGRQLAAIQSAGSRLSDLRRIKASTLVIHGKADLLVRPSGGRATARAIPNARLQLIDGMGHDLPRGAWPQILDGIVRNAATGSTLVAASSGSS
jgi:pimeloyl-ACP methyl ester carboxylesterase